MASTHYNSQQYRRKLHDESEGTVQFLYDGLSREVRQILSQPQELLDWNNDRRRGLLHELRKQSKEWVGKLSRTKVALVIIWIFVLWWGERLVFRRSVAKCRWESWEQWPSEAVPHHVVLLADPQLVDPHTYPGRPFPLSTMTVRHTDLYMRRAFSSLESTLDPDTALFLGDLFDGGREWGTGKDQNPDKQWNKWDGRYWQREYDRFGRIFLDPWYSRTKRVGHTREDRKFIASLPGNHDLGIGRGIRLPVRDRFTTYFGESNRVDFIGNHTFVSVDTVSLSARGQRQSDMTHHDSQQEPNEEIWGIPETFLSQAKRRKAIVVNRELCTRSGRPDTSLLDHNAYELNDTKIPPQQLQPVPDNIPELPTVLLTHVPLYRSPGTPCGPLRERWPPSQSQDGSGELPEKDDRNAIAVRDGYQYQNVLQDDISKELIEKIGNVQHVFSGDDHDYCEVVHHGFTSKGGGVREITVKSMSWAMGVRRPGFLLVSLWNPIDEKGNAVNVTGRLNEGNNGMTTLQSRLCLLPDQMSIFIRYGMLLGLSLSILVVHAFVYGFTLQPNHKNMHGNVLPPDESGNAATMLQRRDRADSKLGSSSCKVSHESIYNGLAARSSAGRPRSLSPANGYGIRMLPDPEHGQLSNGKRHYGHEWHKVEEDSGLLYKDRKGILRVWRELKQSIVQVASVPLFWYIWLAYTS
ncbi:hypothetical protein MMC30_000077 [Trapelia coarctata]|nr:hypothetical protein [Trapelia coarctata]